MRRMLDVPHVRQPVGRPWCGPACAAMLMRYYGRRVSMETFARVLTMERDGVPIDDLGVEFLCRGFDVTLRYWRPWIEPRFRGADSAVNAPDVRRALRTGDPDDEEVQRLKTFLAVGGHLVLDAPMPNDVIKSIARREPPILCVDRHTLVREDRKRAGHYVVATGFDTRMRTLWVNDPAGSRRARFDIAQVMFACHTWKAQALFVHAPKAA